MTVMNAIGPWEPVYDSHDLRLLNQFIQSLVGEPFQFQEIAYGDELRYHFGAMERQTSRASQREMERGQYQLWCRGSDVASTIPERSNGPTISVAIATSTEQGYRLELGFSDGSTLRVTPVHDEIEDLADWELYLPGGRVLHAGSGRVWSCVPSNVPIADLERLAPETFRRQAVPA